MNIQSLSVAVPTGKCWNNCKFCVSKMHIEEYGKSICVGNEIPNSYMNRIKFVRDCGCNTMLFTGTAEPQQNMHFIIDLLSRNRMLDNPFYNIEMQTTGSGMTEEHFQALANNGLTTISFSMSSFIDEENWEINGTLSANRVPLAMLIGWAKKYNLNVRLSINLSDVFTHFTPNKFFEYAQKLDVDQVTFRHLYVSGENEQSNWINEHNFSEMQYEELAQYVKTNGCYLGKLPYGNSKYSVNGISTVIDGDCMSKQADEDLKYAILRPNGHIYSRWDDKGSLIF